MQNLFVVVLLIAACAACQTALVTPGADPMRNVALQSIANFTLTPNLPVDIQDAAKLLNDDAVLGFDSCDELQKLTLQVWQSKRCSAIQLANVQTALATLRNELSLRNAATVV